MKNSFRILLILALALVMVLSLTACASDCELGKHTFEDVSAQSATCTQDGIIAHKHCTVCDGYFDLSGNKLTKEQTVEPALGHNISEYPAVAPTCTQDGNIKYYNCSVCDKNFTDQAGTIECNAIIVEAIGHVAISSVAEVSATCTTNGTKAYQLCACGAKIIDGKQVSDADLVVEASGHTEQVLQAVAPTCQSTGLTEGKYCSVCEEILVAQTTAPALDHNMNQGVITTPVTSTTDGVRTYSCQRNGCNHTYTEKIDKLGPITEPRYVDIYALNDLHGATSKLAKIGGYLKEKKQQDPNTVLLSSGDMFQETLESNSNYGALVNSCMAEIGFECMAIGNHEFDWGMDKLKALKNQTSVKFLGANIYHWDRNSGWGDFASEIADPYHIVNLENGLKVGIIGVIGSEQITSISANLVQTIGFKYPSEVVPGLSEKLRNEEKCDVVIVSIHNGASDTLADSYLDMSKYADAVFCAHSHQRELMEKNGVPFIQGGDDGRYISNIRLKVGVDGEVSCETKQNIAYSSNWADDATVAQMIKTSNDAVSQMANQKIATVNGSFNSQGEYGLPRIVCQAMAEFAKEQGYEIDMALINQARNSLYGGDVTYTQLFNSLPFDNIVYIAEVSGQELLRQASYGNFWRVSGEPIVSSGTYTIAVIDYVLFHQNSSREYNYFPSAFANGKQPIPLVTKENPILNYRDITKAYLLKLGTVNSADYSNSNAHCNKNNLGQSVTFNDAQAQASLLISGTFASAFGW